MQRRIHHRDSGLPHRSFHMNDGVARHAAQAVLRFRSVELVFDRLIEAAIEKDRVIVASGAPLAALRAAKLLHVQNRSLVYTGY